MCRLYSRRQVKSIAAPIVHHGEKVAFLIKAPVFLVDLLGVAYMFFFVAQDFVPDHLGLIQLDEGAPAEADTL
jgi:hypothetical protein